MQATVSAFDPASRAGRVLLDDGRQLAFEGTALDGTRLRLLRPGQRVRIETESLDDSSLRVVRLQILTLH